MPGKDLLTIYGKVTNWYFKTFENKESKLVNNDSSIGQLVANVKTDIDDVFYMNYTIQVDCKDNKYRVRITDIRHTVKGKENAAFFAKFLVNLPAESDNEIFLTDKKGYSKGQRRTIQARMQGMDQIFKNNMASLNKAINVKAESF